MKVIRRAMDHLIREAFNECMTTTAAPTNPILADITKAMKKRSFCTLATTSPTSHPHVAGVIYAMVNDRLYVSTQRSSRKARNIAANSKVFVCIPIRRSPVGPPSTVQFAATAELLGATDPDIVALAHSGQLKAVTGHGELEMDDICFIRITPSRRLLTYGLGLTLRQLIKDPLNAAGVVDWSGRAGPGLSTALRPPLLSCRQSTSQLPTWSGHAWFSISKRSVTSARQLRVGRVPVTLGFTRRSEA